MVKLKDYIKDVLSSIVRGEIEFEVFVNERMELDEDSPNKLNFTLSKWCKY